MVEVGKKYRHYKTKGIYEVLAIAKHTETEEDLVIYQNLATKEVWARPKAMFEEVFSDGITRFEEIKG